MQLSSGRQRRAWSPLLAVVLSLVLPLALPLAVSAQDDGSAADAAAARIDALSGDVAIQRGDANDTLAAVQNAPLLGADYVTTGQNSRAEVGFDGRSAVRLGENVQMRFMTVDPANRQMQLAAGTVELRLFGDTDGQSEVDTPSISVVPRTAGSFRIAVDADGATAVTVRSGRADIITPQGNQSLAPGTTLLAEGPAANPSIQTRPAVALDAFDTYNDARDRIYVAAASDSQYVNTNIQGVGDLNANGNWVDDSSYGHVWIPSNVAPDWAPYRDGNWVWEDSFGWTWVAAEPWGWAPYHYGRWYFSTAYHHWAWYPPAPGRNAPAWSPALVGFIGFNVGAVNVGIGFGNIGWVPLAPFEAFHPWWGPHATTIVASTVDVRYRNFAVNGALTSVTRENFQQGRFANRFAVSQEQLREIRAVPMQGALPIVPSQANLRFTQRAAAPSLAFHSTVMTRTFAGRPPAFGARTPFTEQQASVARVTRVPQAAPAFDRNGSVPAYARPAAPAAAFARPPAAQNFAQPQYSRPANPAFARPAGPAYARPAAPAETRPAAPAFSRSAGPASNRLAPPAYSARITAPYSRPAAPAYSRPAPVAHPQVRATHTDEGRRDR